MLLDDDTESAVMEAINNIDKQITVIIIAHRLTTLKNCDQIVKFETDYQTRILTYEELMNLNKNRGDRNAK